MILAAVGAIAMLQPVKADPAAEVRVTYSNGKFEPGEVSVPVDQPVVLRVKNMDARALEFESTSLRVEKVVAAKSEAVVNVRALKPGRYEFYDDFNANAHGALIVQ
jgi:heme/copper-type cytochrome/quinol oxidase subunit 2